MATDDELAQTATAPASPSALAAPKRATLARFRIDAILGQGGMGVVHAAFDPELERTIALKVLRKSGSDDARTRLLREARAMAKLSHPNVIGVFEVGSADGQDFVAMELIDGETLGEWLRRVRPDERAILAAFVAAGQGLAAAHAAGLVHRDFKPSNVLRSHTGKIVVTDFGLVRTDQADDEAREGGDALTHDSSRTQTGAILGTPAYMAPEQWTGGTITAATDQFAFCIALWEALVGERPYRGDTHDVLRAAVLAASPLGIDKVPRSLRAILLRGLATDAAQRWPSMQALISALERVGRRHTRTIVGAVALGVVAVAVLAVVAFREPRSDECSPPALDPDRVWSVNRAGALAMRDPGTAELVAGDLAAWSALRSRTCAAEPTERPATLLCLDAALARLDHALGSALGRSSRVDADRLATELVDPRMCGRSSPPRVAALTPELSSVFEWARYANADDSSLTEEEVARAQRVSTPCARAVQISNRGLSPVTIDWFGQLETLRDLPTQCDDDKIRAEIALQIATGNDEPNFADAAVARFPQADLRASLATIHARDAARRKQWDEAVTKFTYAIELYAVRHRVAAQVDVVLELSRVLLERGRPEDLIAVQEISTHWLPMAREPARSELQKRMLIVRWHNGELAAADAELERLDATPETITPYSHSTWSSSVTGVSGQVVDQAGNPVANALVSSGAPLVADSATIAISQHTLAKRTTRTDADGRFTLVLASGTVLAQSGARRSAATLVGRDVHLVLAPTSRLQGRVALEGTPASRVWIVARTAGGSDDAAFVAPVREDGSFDLDGVPRGKLVVGAVETGLVAVGARPRHVLVEAGRVDNILLEVTPALYVIGRSADLVPPESAVVFVLANLDPGPHPTIASVMELRAERSRRVDSIRSAYAAKGERSYVPRTVADSVQPGDMLARISDRPSGNLVACAVGFARKQFVGRSGSAALGTEFTKQELACTRVAPGQSVVTIALPTMRKLTR